MMIIGDPESRSNLLMNIYLQNIVEMYQSIDFERYILISWLFIIWKVKSLIQDRPW